MDSMRQGQNKVALAITILKENNMKQATAPDTRPAIAFDTGTEVKTIMDALRAYRVYEVTDEENKEYIRKIEDQFELVLKMFLKK